MSEELVHQEWSNNVSDSPEKQSWSYFTKNMQKGCKLIKCVCSNPARGEHHKKTAKTLINKENMPAVSNKTVNRMNTWKISKIDPSLEIGHVNSTVHIRIIHKGVLFHLQFDVKWISSIDCPVPFRTEQLSSLVFICALFPWSPGLSSGSFILLIKCLLLFWLTVPHPVSSYIQTMSVLEI